MTDRIMTMRRIVIRLVVGVVLVHALALALRSLLEIEHATPRSQQLFTGAWMVAILFVVVPSLKALRTARRS